MSSVTDKAQTVPEAMSAQAEQRKARAAAAEEIVNEWFDHEKRTRLELANPPQEVIDAYLMIRGDYDPDLDKYKVFEADGDSLTRRYALPKLETAKDVAKMHRFLTGKAVVVKTDLNAKRANYRLPALKEKFQVVPPLSEEEFAALKEDIAERGVQMPVVVDKKTGNIIDGHHRLRAWRELINEGHDMAPFTVWEEELTGEQERRDLAWSLNMQRRHLTREQKRELIAARLKETPEWSDRRIAKLLGVSPTTVGGLRGIMEARELTEGGSVQTGHFRSRSKRVGADGKTRAVRRESTGEIPQSKKLEVPEIHKPPDSGEWTEIEVVTTETAPAAPLPKPVELEITTTEPSTPKPEPKANPVDASKTPAAPTTTTAPKPEPRKVRGAYEGVDIAHRPAVLVNIINLWYGNAEEADPETLGRSITRDGPEIAGKVEEAVVGLRTWLDGLYAALGGEDDE